MVMNQNRLYAYLGNSFYFVQSQRHVKILKCLKRVTQLLFKPHYI